MSPQKAKSDDIESQLEQFDYSKMINNLFVRVFADDETLLFDQLDQSLRNKDSPCQVGAAIIPIDTKVPQDFQIRCFKQGMIETQVGETCCLNTAFIEDNYIRVRLNRMMRAMKTMHDIQITTNEQQMYNSNKRTNINDDQEAHK